MAANQRVGSVGGKAMHSEAELFVDLDGGSGSIGTMPSKQLGSCDPVKVDIQLFTYVLTASDKLGMKKDQMVQERLKM